MNKIFTLFIFVFLATVAARAQTPNAWGYNTGYGTVYGSFGLAQTMQSMYNVARAQSQTSATRSAEIKRSAETSSPAQMTSSPAKEARLPVVRNYGRFRPNPTVDTGRSLADALGDTADEKTLIKNIYATTKTVYEKEAAARGWANNVAGGLTFFTLAAVTVYRDVEEPSSDAAAAYFDVINAALDETPGFGTVADKDKQGFNNMLIGFSGILLATHAEAKQNNDAAALATSRKLAGMLIELVLKTNPENIRIENGRIVMK